MKVILAFTAIVCLLCIGHRPAAHAQQPARKSPRLSAEGGPPPAEPTEVEEEEGSPAEKKDVRLGRRMKLFQANREVAVIADTLLDYKTFVRGALANDPHGFPELVDQRGFIAVPNHVDVRIIDAVRVTVEGYEFEVYKVRVLEGESEGVSGWASKKWLFEISGVSAPPRK